MDSHQRGLVSEFIPDPNAEVGHCVHRIAMHPSRPRCAVHAEALGCHANGQRGGVLAGSEWQSPNRFRVCDRCSCPRAKHHFRHSDHKRFPALSTQGKLRVYRSRTGGNEWEALTKGLPQRNCYVNVLRDAMAVDSLDSCGVYFGTTGGQVYASPNGGDNWKSIVRDLPAVLSVEVQTLK